MGVEVKSGGEGVIVADRGCNDGCCCNGRNSGWGAALKTTSTTPA